MCFFPECIYRSCGMLVKQSCLLSVFFVSISECNKIRRKKKKQILFFLLVVLVKFLFIRKIGWNEFCAIKCSAYLSPVLQSRTTTRIIHIYNYKYGNKQESFGCRRRSSVRFSVYILCCYSNAVPIWYIKK
jgi:hypothetical protein